MRRGMQGLALQVQEQLKCDPHGGDLYISGRRGDLASGCRFYAKRLDRGNFMAVGEGGRRADLGGSEDMLEGIDWWNCNLTWRPKSRWVSAGQAKKNMGLHAQGTFSNFAKTMIPFVLWIRLRGSSDDVAVLKAALTAERARRLEVAADLAVARARASEDMALITAQSCGSPGRAPGLGAAVGALGAADRSAGRSTSRNLKPARATGGGAGSRQDDADGPRLRPPAAPSATCSPHHCRASGW